MVRSKKSVRRRRNAKPRTEVRASPLPANTMRFISLDEAHDRLCHGPFKVDRDAFIRMLKSCSDRERAEVAELLMAEKFGEL